MMVKITTRELARAVTSAGHCQAGVVRGGELDDCGRPPVAVVRYEFEGTEDYSPVCAWHVSRHGPGVPLSEIVAALREVAS